MAPLPCHCPMSVLTPYFAPGLTRWPKKQTKSELRCEPNGRAFATAVEAGTAYEISIGGTAGNVSDGWSCPNSPNLISVCATNSAGNPLYCWGYEGSEAGQVATGACPWAEISTWN
jgi:hypothetical protein